METRKVIQIIPTSAPMWAMYKEQGKNREYVPVACLALVESESGERSVVPMRITAKDGTIDFVDSPSNANFIGISFVNPF